MVTRVLLEDKLLLTLFELETSKSLCKQLLAERDDSGKDVLNILNKNNSVKKQKYTLNY